MNLEKSGQFQFLDAFGGFFLRQQEIEENIIVV